MNLRRYALFLIVALLTFVIGVTAAVIAGRFNPLTRVETRRPCGRMSSLPGPRKPLFVYTVYRTDGTVVRALEVDKSEESESKVPESPAVNVKEVEPPPPPPAPARPRAPREQR